MTRKRTSWVMVWALVPALAMLFLGCPKKKAEPMMDEIPVETTTAAPPPAQEVKAPPKPMIEDETEDPLDSEDLRIVNEEAARRGFSPNVYFEFDKSDLSDDARERLARNAEFLNSHPNLLVRIEGHCDERGTNEYNIALGDRRANTAQAYMGQLNVGGGQLSTLTFGEERPVCTESDEACWWRNRRAHMVIIGKR